MSVESSTQVRSLLVLSLHALSTNLQDGIVYLTNECKQKLLEMCASHRLLADPLCVSYVSLPRFGLNLLSIKFFASDDLTDSVLLALTEYNKNLRCICLVDCPKITDLGIQSLTADQSQLESLELRAMNGLTEDAFQSVRADNLKAVDISACTKISSLRHLLGWNRLISRLCINSCTGLDDQALYDIAYYLGSNLVVLEMDFFHRLSEPVEAISHLSQNCPNLSSLSLIRFFHQDVMGNEPTQMVRDCHINEWNLRSVDLYENYFTEFPLLPASIQSISISLSGNEDVPSLVSALAAPFLTSISIKLYAKEDSATSLNNANRLLSTVCESVGEKIHSLQIAVYHLYDDSLELITQRLPNLKHFVLRCVHANNRAIHKWFNVGSAGSRLRTLKISGMRVSYRALFSIARGARALKDLEMQNMRAMDDRVLSILAENCRQLSTIDVNGCNHVTDKGLQALAKRCPLREIYIRGTGATDATLYSLARFCPNLEIISFQVHSPPPLSFYHSSGCHSSPSILHQSH
ncbi:hypothetical protein PENTCL1PPCAC_6502 [Pristionchus entomophagus]|uniref:F-box/LRR-repeat protein 15-like leucin rich repeat domain-containing protein n=1 Tax=Pristionchus entomophagus TaxID=358040 RepID=A0AAV5SLU2_9BILA|nr:hypothetical protein PENTCL1PPCAC_6502 [Pristionchus entomophagus]